MKKILYVTQSSFYPEAAGGAQISTITLIKGLLKENDWQMEVICQSRPKKELFKTISVYVSLLTTLFRKANYLCWRLPKHLPRLFIFMFLQFRLSRFKPDLIVGDRDPRCYLLNLSLESGIPCCNFVRNTFWIKNKDVFPIKSTSLLTLSIPMMR